MKEKSKKEEMLERIERTISDLQGCKDPEKIGAIGQREHDWIFENYAKSSAGTIISRDYLPAIDRAFPPSDGDKLKPIECWQKVNGESIKRHKIVQTLMPTKEEWDERNLKSKQASGERINSKLPLKPTPLIDRATELLNSNSWAAIAAGLIALTGRRPSEIAWCGEFEPESEYSLIFKGQLKKGKIESIAYEIATLIKAETVLNGYHSLRNLQRNKTKILEITDAREADRKTNAQINLAIRKHFSGIIEPPADRKGKSNHISASNLRAAYGKIAAHFYCPPSIEPILYVGQILGHQCESYTTEAIASTINYYTYYIPENVSKIESETENDRYSDGETNSYEGKNLAGSEPDLVKLDYPNRELIATNNNSDVSETEGTNVTDNRSSESDVSESDASESVSKNVSKNPTDATNEDFDDNNARSGTQLADRLGKSLPTIGRNRKKGDRHFASWSAKLDPDGVGWKYLKEGKLRSTGHDRSVDIYVPISPTELTDNVSQINDNVTDNGLTVEGNNLNRFNALASKLNLKGDRDRQLTQLFDWVESNLQDESVENNTNDVSKQDVSKNDSGDSLPLQERQSTIVTAIETIADFSSNLKYSIAPLTTELKRVVDKLDNLPQLAADKPPQVAVVAKSVADQGEVTKTENPPQIKSNAKLDDSLCESRHSRARTGESVSSAPQIIPVEELQSTLDALDTAIALKRAAITKEKKKRSKSNQAIIASWQAEIERLENSIDFLSQLEPQ